jgi:hypothetical protein
MTGSPVPFTLGFGCFVISRVVFAMASCYHERRAER